MNKFLLALFVSTLFVCTFADESDSADLSNPQAFVEKNLADQPADIKASVIEGIKEFQNFNLTGFQSKFDTWPAKVQKFFKE